MVMVHPLREAYSEQMGRRRELSPIGETLPAG